MICESPDLVARILEIPEDSSRRPAPRRWRRSVPSAPVPICGGLRHLRTTRFFSLLLSWFDFETTGLGVVPGRAVRFHGRTIPFRGSRCRPWLNSVSPTPSTWPYHHRWSKAFRHSTPSPFPDHTWPTAFAFARHDLGGKMFPEPLLLFRHHRRPVCPPTRDR